MSKGRLPAMARKVDTEPSQIAETVKTIVWAAVIAVVIRTFAYEPFSIPSGSMIPTLLIGDYLSCRRPPMATAAIPSPGASCR